MRRAIVGYFRAVGRCLAWAGLGLLAIPMLAALLFAIATSLIVVGIFLLPGVMWLQQRLSNAAARLAGGTIGEAIAVASAPRSEETRAGRSQQILTDSGLWRALAWDLAAVILLALSLAVALVPWVNVRAAAAQAALAARLLSARPVLCEAAGADETRERRGHGLVGMSERVDMLGGTLHTGPTADGGFAVRVRIPLAESQEGPHQ